MTKPLPDWLSRIPDMKPGEVIVVDGTKTGSVRKHLLTEEIATGRKYKSAKNKLGDGITIARKA